MQGFSVSYDINHNRNMLRLVRFDGAFLPRLYLYFQPPNMLPTQQLWTSEAYKTYETAQGRSSDASRNRNLMSIGGIVGLGAAVMAWGVMA